MKKIIIVLLLSVMVMSCAARHDEELESQNLDIKVKESDSFDDVIFIRSTTRESPPVPTDIIDTSYTAERLREAILTDAAYNLSGGKIIIEKTTMELGGDSLKITVADIKNDGVDVIATVGKNMPLLLSTLKDIINDEWLDSSQKSEFLVDISTVKRSTTTDTKTSKKLETLIITFKAFARADNQIAPDLAKKEYTIEITLSGENDKWQKETPFSSIDLIIDVDMSAIERNIKGKFKDATVSTTAQDKKIKPVNAANGKVFTIDIAGTILADNTTKIVSAADIDKFIDAIILGLDESRETDDKFSIKEDESKRKISASPDNNILTIYLTPKAIGDFTLPATANNKFYKVQLKLTEDYTWAGEETGPTEIKPTDLFPILTDKKIGASQLFMLGNDYGIHYDGAKTFISKDYVTKGTGNVDLVIKASLKKIGAKHGVVGIERHVSAKDDLHGIYTFTSTAEPSYIFPNGDAGPVTYTVILKVENCTTCNATPPPENIYCK